MSCACVELVCLLLCLIHSSIAKSFKQAQAQVFLFHLLFAMLIDQSFASVCLSQCLFILSSAQSSLQSSLKYLPVHWLQISTVEDEVRDLQNQVDTLKADEHSAARVNNETLGHIREEHSKQMKQIEDNNAQIK